MFCPKIAKRKDHANVLVMLTILLLKSLILNYFTIETYNSRKDILKVNFSCT